MQQQTAISWLREKLQETYDKEGKLPLAYTFSLLNKAETLEKGQIIKAWEDRVSKLPEPKGYMINFTSAEEYYNDIYGNRSSKD